MIQTLNKHVKWRRDNFEIFICDCKRLIDLKISFDYEPFIEKLFQGVERKNLSKREKLVLSDFEKMNFLSELKIRQLNENNFSEAMKILDKELIGKRVRGDKFLLDKFKEFPRFFKGIFLDKLLFGVICGFPREDYLLISELAVDSRFRRRGFGKKLVKSFEQNAQKKGYNKINVGAKDNALGFYSSLDYKPFLLIQYKEGYYSIKDFKKLNVLKCSDENKQKILKIGVEKIDLSWLKKLRENYPKANFQYIFTKNLN